MPKGFEKFLKKAREGRKVSTNEDESKKEAQKESGKKPEEGEKKDGKSAKNEEDEDLTEEEMEAEEAKKSKNDERTGNAKKKINEFFFQPNGKGPRWENFGLVAFLTGAFGYYMFLRRASSEEITYMDFVNSYLATRQCTMITISEDKNSDMFKFRAQVDTVDGKKVHLVLPQVENFLLKIDMAQREMGKSPNDFVPVKYANSSEDNTN